MGWFWAESSSRATRPQSPAATLPPSSTGGCPVRHGPKAASKPDAPSACPYQPPTNTSSPSSSNPSSSTAPSYISKLNPLNYMPSNISNERQSPHQIIHLPLEREPSTIPRGDGEGTWEYPSPQQMYNAMLRKGYTDTPAEHVESMVAVHNFLNEGAWEEIREWERRFAPGMGHGWEICKYGEAGSEQQLVAEALRQQRRGQPVSYDIEPTLLRFTGRPNEPTPKARMLSFMAWLYPAKFPDNPPFDRHDWFVRRRAPDGRTSEVRYVIDYYSGPTEATGEPVFFLDVRPAVDGPTAACERLVRWGGDVWWRAKGGNLEQEKNRLREEFKGMRL